MPRIHLKVEGKIVYLMEDSRNLGGVSSSELETDTKLIVDFFERITKECGLRPNDIQKIVRTVGTKGGIIGFGGDFLSFCYWSASIDRFGGIGVKNLVRSISRRKSCEEILSDIFVAQIAAKYATNHKIELRVRKTEIGCDLLIDGLRCECKVRLGYFMRAHKTLDLTFSDDDKQKGLDKLATNELHRIWKNRVEEAFFEQNADVVFLDVSRTSVGFYQIAEEVFSSNSLRNPPELKRYMIILYSILNGTDLWKPIFIDPKIFAR